MRRSMITSAILISAICVLSFEQSCVVSSNSHSTSFPEYKWVYLINNLDTPQRLNDAKKVATDAASYGLNGIVLTAYVDTITSWSEQRKANLRDFKTHCDNLGIEIIPQVFSVGYGYAVLEHDPNFAAAIKFDNCSFKVSGKFARRDENRMNMLPNARFENIEPDGKPSNFEVVDRLDQAVFVDRTISYAGDNSIRLEKTPGSVASNARIRIPVELEPRTEYEVSYRIRTQNLTPLKSFRAAVYAHDLSSTFYSTHRDTAPVSSNEWIKQRHRFFTAMNTSGLLYIGFWGATSGTVWVDDIRLSRVADGRDVIRRAGTPIVVKSADRGMVFKEGVDYNEYAGLKTLFPQYQDLVLELTDNSRILDGENLLVSGYSAARIPKGPNNFQSSVCMSIPELYEYWERQMAEVYPILKMEKAFLALDEIRAGGVCELCVHRNMSMAQILGDSVHKQFEILREYDSDMEIFAWSDMFDPNANARDNYFFAQGSFENSWEYVPQDLVMVNWINVHKDKSLRFFSGEGFRTMGSPYFDRQSIDDTKEWYAELKNTEGALGLMYVTWENDYSFLRQYADVVTSSE